MVVPQALVKARKETLQDITRLEKAINTRKLQIKRNQDQIRLMCTHRDMLKRDLIKGGFIEGKPYLPKESELLKPYFKTHSEEEMLTLLHEIQTNSQLNLWR